MNDSLIGRPVIDKGRTSHFDAARGVGRMVYFRRDVGRFFSSIPKRREKQVLQNSYLGREAKTHRGRGMQGENI